MKRESIVLQANLSLSLKLTSKGPSIKKRRHFEGGGGSKFIKFADGYWIVVKTVEMGEGVVKNTKKC